MKKITSFTFIIVCLSVFAQAQPYTEDVDFIQSIYGKEKRMIISDFIELEEFQKEDFWSLYDSYETQRKELGKKRITLLSQYIDNYGRIDDITTSKIIHEIGSVNIRTDKLIITYHKKIEKAVGIKAAAQFFQLEVYFLSVVRMTVLENIPFIGELK